MPSGARTDISLALALVLTGVIFSLWPWLDIWASRLFFCEGQGFCMAEVPAIGWIRARIRDLMVVVFLAAGLALPVALWLRGPGDIASRVLGFTTLLFLLGPGLLVNGILKEFWGRARPADIAEFGGEKLFTPPLRIADQCATNCSFVSGEGAGATALAISAWVLTERIADPVLRWRIRAVVNTLAAVAVALRVMTGRHFLSDTVFAVLFVAALALVLGAILRLPWAVAPRDVP